LTNTALKQNRHLAAILFSDIVGYSSLSHRNELLAFSLLREHRAIVRPLLLKHGGREIKTMGDGFMAEFDNAMGATMCAIDIQLAHLERNKKIERDSQILLRIGIHAGDVMPSEGDIYGDGVNIAARLMQFAKPGRICISSTVMDQARQVIPHWVSYLGPTRLKGISREILTYAICVEFQSDAPPPLLSVVKNRVLRAARKYYPLAVPLILAVAAWLAIVSPRSGSRGSADSAIRIAVLPLEGIGLGPDYAYLSDGVTEELISSLSDLSNIRVLSKDSSLRLKEQKRSASEIGSELNVEEVVEGSLERVDKQLRIHVRLIDTRTQESRWSEIFEGQIANIFDIQKKIAGQIATKLMGRHTVGSSGAQTRKPNGEAYQHYLKALHLLQFRTEYGFRKSLEELEAATEKDPQFAPAHASMAITNHLMGFYGFLAPKEAREKSEASAKRAIALEPANSDALLWFAEKSAYMERKWPEADSYFKRAISSNPSSAMAYHWYGEFLAIMGHFSEAGPYFDKALELNPLSQTTISASGLPYYFLGRYDEAIKIFRSAIEIDPHSIIPLIYLGQALYMKGDFSGALEVLEKASSLSPDFKLIEALTIGTLVRLGRESEAKRKFRVLLKRARSEYISHYILALGYQAFGEKEKALDELSLAVREYEAKAIYLKVEPMLAPLRDSPRFRALLRDAGFSDTANSGARAPLSSEPYSRAYQFPGGCRESAEALHWPEGPASARRARPYRAGPLQGPNA
jgi:adenylate cyclase